MDRSKAYKLLSTRLAEWGKRSYPELVQAISLPTCTETVWQEQEPIEIEVIVR